MRRCQCVPCLPAGTRQPSPKRLHALKKLHPFEPLLSPPPPSLSPPLPSLPTPATEVSHSANLGSALSLLAVSGCLEAGGYKLSAATRDGRLHALRGGGGDAGGGGGGGGGLLQHVGAAQLEAPAVGLVRIGAAALVCTMADAVHCYAGAGAGAGGFARQYSLPQPAPVVCMQLVAAHTARPTKALAVALASGEVRVYHGRSLVSAHVSPGGAPALAMAFGRYAREDNALASVLRGGCIDFKARQKGGERLVEGQGA